jgi:hypothetical protein
MRAGAVLRLPAAGDADVELRNMTEAEKRRRLRRMRLAALSAVALMLALFLASSLLRDRFAAAR